MHARTAVAVVVRLSFYFEAALLRWFGCVVPQSGAGRGAATVSLWICRLPVLLLMSSVADSVAVLFRISQRPLFCFGGAPPASWWDYFTFFFFLFWSVRG